MTPNAIQTLREVNRTLGSALYHLRPERTHCSAIQPQDFAGLLSEIVRGAACLQIPSSNTETGTQGAQETAEYRSHLEALKLLLPDLHGNLLAEKSRLEAAQTHSAVAAAWARASSRTL